MAEHTETEDPFDNLLTLEDQYYQEGLALGIKDGSRSGRIEGRQFGLEKGFEKFAAMGALAGQSAVWEARISSRRGEGTVSDAESSDDVPKTGPNTAQSMQIPPLAANERLQKHIQTLSALTEPESLSTQNNEDSVSEFDDRFKRAQGKVKVIQNIIGETGTIPSDTKAQSQKKGNGNMEDFSMAQPQK